MLTVTVPVAPFLKPARIVFVALLPNTTVPCTPVASVALIVSPTSARSTIA